jgi:segregation and condensation protein B
MSEAESTHRPEFEAAVEAILFVTSEPVPEERILGVFEPAEREEAAAALAAVRARYAGGEGRGVRLEEVAGGLRIVTAPECHPYLRKFFDAAGANRLSMAALETLAIVAYRQPVTGPEVQELRGKNSAAAIKTLLERRLLRITGRKEVVGRPFVYATTREFLMHFGLRSLSELPPLEEFEEAFGGGDTEALPSLEAPISHEHEVIGLVSTDEAEEALNSASFEIHEHAEHPGTAANSDDEPAGTAAPQAHAAGSAPAGAEHPDEAESAELATSLTEEEPR